MKCRNKLGLIGLLLLALPLAAQNNTVVLKRAFVEQYKDRATIDASFFVDHAHKQPNAPAADGDMHLAGRAQNEIGLPMVAEVMNAVQPVTGFQPYDAATAFGSYEKLKVTVSATSSAVSISASKAAYNYAEFEMTLAGSPKMLADGGYAVLANVNGKADESIASNIRMIFVPGTPPLQQLLSQKLGDGDTMRVIGIPRINLNAISTFINASGGQTLSRKLPYEMIIVAVVK